MYLLPAYRSVSLSLYPLLSSAAYPLPSLPLAHPGAVRLPHVTQTVPGITAPLTLPAFLPPFLQKREEGGSDDAVAFEELDRQSSVLLLKTASSGLPPGLRKVCAMGGGFGFGARNLLGFSWKPSKGNFVRKKLKEDSVSSATCLSSSQRTHAFISSLFFI